MASTMTQAELMELPDGVPVRPLPPLAAIRAFEASARHQSFSRAAEELNMTPAAVSYQIKQLEARLGMTLFQRMPRKVLLTRAGEQLAPMVLDAFRTLQSAFSMVMERAEGELAITSLPTIASAWLVPRLGAFKAAQPHLQVRLDISVPLADLDLGAFDVGIRSGRGQWPGMDAHYLLPNLFTPLISPKLRDSVGGLDNPRDLLALPLIGRAKWWRLWFDQAGCADAALDGRTGVDFGIEHFDVTAAVAGHGVAIASPIFFARELESGQLVQPFSHVTEDGGGYWLAYPQVHARTTKIRSFAAWIKAEAERARTAYAARR